MKARKWMVRIVALLMALLMGLGIFGFLFQILASATDGTVLSTVVNTGVQNKTTWPIFIALAAVLIIVVCVVVPKMLKKK